MHVFSLTYFSQLPHPLKWLVVAMVWVFLMSTTFFIFIKPKMDYYLSLTRQAMDLKHEFELKQQQASTLKAERHQLYILQQHLNQMLKKLPTVNEISGLIDDISKLIIASGLVYELLAPMPANKHGRFIEWPVKIILVGHYQQLWVFITMLAESEQRVILQDFVIEPVFDKEKEETREQRLSIKMTLKLYSDGPA